MKEIVTYLNFDGKTREAMTFYAKVLGAELQIMSFADTPCDAPPAMKDRIAHARLSKGATLLMASDSDPRTTFQTGNNFDVCIQCESLEEIERLFQELGEGGSVRMPLADMFWGARFGLVTDRFGVNWMFNYELPKG